MTDHDTVYSFDPTRLENLHTVLVKRQFLVARALLTTVKPEEVVSIPVVGAVLRVLEQQHLVIPFFETLVRRKLQNKNDCHLFLRDHSPETTVLRHFVSTTLVDDFLTECLGEPLMVVLKKRKDMEVNSTMVTDESVLYQHQQNLRQAAQLVLDRIFASVSKIPILIARMCAVLAKELETAGLDTSASLVTKRLSVRMEESSSITAAAASSSSSSSVAVEEEQELPSSDQHVGASHSDPSNILDEDGARIGHRRSDSTPPIGRIPLFTREERIAGTESQAVAAVVFLRLVCPAIVRSRCIPAKHASKVLDRTQRSFSLIAKMIQTLANQGTFTSFMAPMNSFLEVNEAKYKAFCHAVVQRGQSAPSSCSSISGSSNNQLHARVSEELLAELEPDWDVLFSFIRDRQIALSETIAQLAPDRMSAVVTTRSLALLAQGDSPRTLSTSSGQSSGDEATRVSRLSGGTLAELMPEDRKANFQLRQALSTGDLPTLMRKCQKSRKKRDAKERRSTTHRPQRSASDNSPRSAITPLHEAAEQEASKLKQKQKSR
eukprot:CAMPEP_0177639176 /NCGR_PEP_ID=MMETSP0447-20121125/5883_1 /TAXON_ID=0 /ORGANISM="Stygamoeba regulata, Strain BSH-02190019" /LENGTH=547 /DNA_ID=CAMNT_0019141189 /DNA_START=134 /DNA_END=1777 /DNA_ORIENTATION=-